jgi:nucleotide-binding universal stress UspA family protein
LTPAALSLRIKSNRPPLAGGFDLKIMVTTAGSVPAKKKADYLVTIASRADAQLIVLHVVDSQDEYEDGQQALDIFQRQKTTPKIRSILRIGRLTDTIAKTAQEEGVDLIILGLDERGDISSAISREILAKADIPVLLVPNLD